MTIYSFLTPRVCSLLIACALFPASAMSHQTTAASQQQSESTVDGAVVSSTRDTLVVRTEDNQFHLFVFDDNTEKPQSISAGARVSVVSRAGEEVGVRVASVVTTLETP